MIVDERAGGLRRFDPTETAEERMARGKALRERAPRSANARWQIPAERRDPVSVLQDAEATRMPQLVPIRYYRMSLSPFAFYRGSAAVMAADLATTPASGIALQSCGDGHLMNFGAYASPERTLVFDINDFDETFVAPFEWDVKRLCASIVLAARSIALAARAGDEAVAAAVAAYRERMLEAAELTPLETLYLRVDGRTIAELQQDELRKLGAKAVKKASKRTLERTYPKLTEVVNGKRHIVDAPPLIFHTDEIAIGSGVMFEVMNGYRSTLRADQAALLDRYELVDAAVKVVGVGSVGTLCAIGLFVAGSRDHLLLQVKEANHSVLEPFVAAKGPANQGERVVNGQRMMQAVSDIFLGWTHSPKRNYYIRQLRDMKASAEVDEMSAASLISYAHLCGLTLARAHARTGDPALLAGYLGTGSAFDGAIVDFSNAYADQAERDHAVLTDAIKTGRLAVKEG